MITKRKRKPAVKRKQIADVRTAVFHRSHGFCEMRAHLIAELNKQVNSGKLGYSHAQEMMRRVLVGCGGKITLETMHWAHIKSRGASGEDSVENTLASCSHCHLLQHAGIKPCPSKEQP